MKNSQLIQQLSEVLIQAEQLAELIEKVSDLEKQVKNLKSDSSKRMVKWIPMSVAAKEIGISKEALRQRIKRFNYPQNIAWKQRDKNSAIFINMNKIVEYL